MPARVELIGGDYEHALGLAGVRHGVEISYTTAPLSDVFYRMLTERCYEACEFSLANYLMLRDRGEDWLEALPVFPYRAFRHSTLVVRAGSALASPRDLPGKRVGVPDFSMTAAVWTRGIMAEHYSVDWRDIRWVVAAPQRFAALRGVELERIEGDLEQALVEGRIDALLTTRTRDEHKPAPQRQLRTLIPDARQAEEDYFARTGIYPINHLVAIRRDVLDRVPGLPAALVEAYTQAKQAAYERRLGTTTAPWSAAHWRRVFDLFGGDPLPYGLVAPNLKTLAVFGRYLREQQLIGREPDLPALFRAAPG
jgi:4,5-dihydroxyphthalate decarboxylase